MLLTVGNVGVRGKIPIMIQEQMKFDRSLGAAELSPREKRQAKRYSGGVQRKQLVLESELAVFRSSRLAHVCHFIK